MSSADWQGRGLEVLERVHQLVRQGDGAPSPQRPALESALTELHEMLAELPRREAEWRRKLEDLESAQSDMQDQALRYRELFDYAPDAYVVTDLAGIIRAVNHTATVLFGRQKAFLVDKPLPFFFHRDDRWSFYARLATLHKTMNRPDVWEAHLATQRREGPSVTVALSVTIQAGDRRQPTGFRWLIRDVTVQKEADEARRAALTFNEGLLEAAQVLVLVVDGAGRLLRTNTHLEEVTGYCREELVNRSWQALLFESGEQPPAFREPLATGRGVHALHPLQTCGGRRRTIEWFVRPLPDAQGRMNAVLVVGHDVTELEEAQGKAVQLERLAAIGQTATALAHESRNALQRGHACLERLHWKLEGQADALELVERAQRAQDDLLRLFEDVREYAAPIRIKAVPCDPAAVWREVWADLLAVAPERDARLEEHTLPEAEQVCLADRFRLIQVFRNILENALAACPDPVRVVVTCQATEWSGQPALRIGVRNNGPRFTEEQKQRLFEPFFTTKPKGTGLGLAIVKRIIEAHGGAVAVGQVAAGAEILITLPRSIP